MKLIGCEESNHIWNGFISFFELLGTLLPIAAITIYVSHQFFDYDSRVQSIRKLLLVTGKENSTQDTKREGERAVKPSKEEGSLLDPVG